MRQIIIISLFILTTSSCGIGDRKDVSTANENCDFQFEINVESSNSYSYNSKTGHLRKLINPFKETKFYADTTFSIPKTTLCDLMEWFQSYEISEYPNEYRPESGIEMTPEPSYYIRFQVENQETEINWTKNTETFSSKDAYRLYQILNKIDSIILSSHEFRQLPEQEYEWL